MEKLKKEKHSHKATTILKNIIFACVMLAPFISVLARCMYVICNPNAKDSYSGSYSYLTTQNLYQYYQATDRTIVDELTTNNVVHYKAKNTNFSGQIDNINFNNYSNATLNSITIFNVDNLYQGSTYLSTIKSIAFVQVSGSRLIANTFDIRFDFNSMYVNIDDSSYGYSSYRDYTGNLISSKVADYRMIFNGVKHDFMFSFINVEENIFYQVDNSNLKNFEKSIFYTDTTLSNAFEYSINNLENDNLYNWSKQLGIYTPLNDMVSGLGGNSTISMLLAYWSILTAIYIVFDIIIWSFTKITHFISAD